MMMPLARWLESGGLMMYILLFGLAPLVALAGLFHIILANRKSFVQLCFSLALPLSSGIWMTTVFRSRNAAAIADALPKNHLELAVRGYPEANRPFELALVIVLAGLLPFTLGEIRRSRKSGRSARREQESLEQGGHVGG